MHMQLMQSMHLIKIACCYNSIFKVVVDLLQSLMTLVVMTMEM